MASYRSLSQESPTEDHALLSPSFDPVSFLMGWNAALGDTKTFDSPEALNRWITSVLNPKDQMSFDTYMMRIAHLAAQRSIDPSTKHGSVIANAKNRVVGIGYNGPPRKLPHDLIEWTRPEKYSWMLHAEENAMSFANEDLEDCTIYVTGPSCARCFLQIAQAGIKRCVFGPRVAKCIDAHTTEVREKIAAANGIELVDMDSI